MPEPKVIVAQIILGLILIGLSVAAFVSILNLIWHIGEVIVAFIKKLAKK